MEGTQPTTSTQANQGVTQSTSTSSSANSASTSDEFIATLRSFLGNGSASEVSEEDLFAAIVRDKISALKGDEGLEKFNQAYEEASNAIRRPDGFVSPEDATKAALRALRDSEYTTSEETDSVYSEAFAGAQIDDNEEALFDSRGSATDPTKAVAAMEAALLGVRTRVAEMDEGKLDVKTRSVDEESFGHHGFGGAVSGDVGAAGAGFLWKPISDSDSKLAVLMPPSLAGKVAKVSLTSPDGTLIEEGRSAGNGNGGRDHFRFSKPGGSYADGTVVEVKLTSGQVLKYLIGDTSSRVENISPEGLDDSESQGTSTTPTTSAAKGEADTTSPSESDKPSANQDL